MMEQQGLVGRTNKKKKKKINIWIKNLLVFKRATDGEANIALTTTFIKQTKVPYNGVYQEGRSIEMIFI